MMHVKFPYNSILRRLGAPAALVFSVALITGLSPTTAAEPGEPRAADARLVVERFATAPDIVHPINLDFDAKGRLLVIESHTHFRPQNYVGPPHDCIRMLEDADGDGKAERITTFFEGTIATMDLAVHPDGSVYLATRNEILRLRDTNNDGKADEKVRLAFLDTKGTYPHDGLSGLSFDFRGNVTFGMGENLGEGYKLIGADGATLAGGGEGGNIYHCTADGKNLVRIATGFWNPFGTTRDIYNRLFAIDNDPDAMPPCRLLHVVEGGDYGYQFRYGRSGRHPFQAWNGQLPGTLPMVSGTGESPCEVLSYESDGLPEEYRGNLLIPVWADHRIERYALKPQGASFTADRLPFIQGPADFRPVGLAVAPDGSLFFSDWVLQDYNLHKHGSIWHIKQRNAPKPDRPSDPRKALLAVHRPAREAAARTLAADDAGKEFLRQHLSDPNPQTRVASLAALIKVNDAKTDLLTLADKDPETGIRALAVQGLIQRGESASVQRFASPVTPAEVRSAAVSALTAKADLPILLDFLADDDPFLRSAAVRQLAHHADLLAAADKDAQSRTRVRIGLLLAHRASGNPDAHKRIPGFLSDPDEDVRFLAVKWISDEKLVSFQSDIASAMKDPKLNVRMYSAYATAHARLDNQNVDDANLVGYFLRRAADAQSPANARRLALQQAPSDHAGLTPDLLISLIYQEDPDLRMEAVRALSEHPNPRRIDLLRKVVNNTKWPMDLRAQAIVGLADQSHTLQPFLLDLAKSDQHAFRDEALRNLINVPLSAEQHQQLENIAQQHPETSDLVRRSLGKPFFKNRPDPTDNAAWLARLEGPADSEAGRRIFFQAKLAACSRCHRIDGRGALIGPELSAIGRTDRRHILESLLQPSNTVAPHYQVWQIITADGRVRTGMLTRTYLDESTYLDEKGNLFTVNTRDIDETRAVPVSIMPKGLPNLFTDQELRDLLAFLCSRQ